MDTKEIREWITKNKWGIIILVVLLIASYYIAKQIQTEFQPIKTETSVDLNMLKISNPYLNITNSSFNIDFSNISLLPLKADIHDKYCGSKFNDSSLTPFSISVDNKYTPIGEQLQLVNNLTLEDFNNSKNNFLDYGKIYSGTEKENLHELKPGENKLDLFYSNGENITVYSLICFNRAELSNGLIRGWTSSKIDIAKPYFLKNKWVFLISIGTIFIGLYQILEIVLNYLGLKKYIWNV